MTAPPRRPTRLLLLAAACGAFGFAASLAALASDDAAACERCRLEWEHCQVSSEFPAACDQRYFECTRMLDCPAPEA